MKFLLLIGLLVIAASAFEYEPEDDMDFDYPEMEQGLYDDMDVMDDDEEEDLEPLLGAPRSEAYRSFMRNAFRASYGGPPVPWRRFGYNYRLYAFPRKYPKAFGGNHPFHARYGLEAPCTGYLPYPSYAGRRCAAPFVANGPGFYGGYGGMPGY
eukprot:gnl/Trimastix_PCT/1447.p1 GENE.gnl/Trimastix_PCT/1447~~gnl/Trimastix_PCT/1447.p1  ORF type:complete len:154 (-),score=14.89 gnl/Trimastix_PCT/1447:36-497(-)